MVHLRPSASIGLFDGFGGSLREPLSRTTATRPEATALPSLPPDVQRRRYAQLPPVTSRFALSLPALTFAVRNRLSRSSSMMPPAGHLPENWNCTAVAPF